MLTVSTDGTGRAAAGFFYRTRRTTVLTARESIVVEGGILLPKGTQLIHDRSMTEGFETLRLYVNVSTADLPKHFTQRQERMPFW